MLDGQVQTRGGALGGKVEPAAGAVFGDASEDRSKRHGS